MAEEVEVSGVITYETTAVSTGDFKVFLAEPVYDDSYDIVIDQVLTDQAFELDVTSLAYSTSVGYHTLNIEWIVSQEFSEDDYLQVTFNTDIPADLVAAGDTIQQWVQFGLDRDTTGLMQTVACNIGDSLKESRTYFGLDEFSAETSTDYTRMNT